MGSAGGLGAVPLKHGATPEELYRIAAWAARRMRCSSAIDIRDLVQEAVMAELRGLDSWAEQPGGCKLSTWLIKHAMNAVLSFVRRAQRPPPETLDGFVARHGTLENSTAKLLLDLRPLRDLLSPLAWQAMEEIVLRGGVKPPYVEMGRELGVDPACVGHLYREIRWALRYCGLEEPA